VEYKVTEEKRSKKRGTNLFLPAEKNVIKIYYSFKQRTELNKKFNNKKLTLNLTAVG
jgi:hypothetical protein